MAKRVKTPIYMYEQFGGYIHMWQDGTDKKTEYKVLTPEQFEAAKITIALLDVPVCHAPDWEG